MKLHVITSLGWFKASGAILLALIVINQLLGGGGGGVAAEADPGCDLHLK